MFSTPIPRKRKDFKDIVQLTQEELLGVRFRFSYGGGMGCKPYIVSYSGMKPDGTDGLMTNFHWGQNDDGTINRAIIVVAIDQQCLPHSGGDHIRVMREYWLPDPGQPDGTYYYSEDDNVCIPKDGPVSYSQIVINCMRGEPGKDGTDGIDGNDGESAYQIAVRNGYEGTEQQWLEYLRADIDPTKIEAIEKHAIEVSTTAAVAAANQVIEEQRQTILELKEEVRQLKGTDPDSESAKSPEIDNNEENKNFLDGFTNQDKLKNILDEQNQPLTDEQMQNVLDMFPTE